MSSSVSLRTVAQSGARCLASEVIFTDRCPRGDAGRIERKALRTSRIKLAD